MKDAGFEFKEHTADIRVKSWGKSLEEAFSQTAFSLMTTISPDLTKINPEIEKTIKITSEDIGALLFDFLSEFL
ncbi:MAG: archease, partial [Candidatus Hermodarchaeota archaeon]